ncbi:MAG: amino acid ABC transporter permease [Anaerolineae bacterium]|nr:amino acid ABC transporter permease [Anaerolineae bacterium]
MQPIDPAAPQQVVRSRTLPVTHYLAQFPWWLIGVALIAVLFAWQLTTDSNYQVIFQAVISGLWITITVTLVAYAFALLLGLLLAVIRLSKPASVVTARRRNLPSRIAAYVRWGISIVIYQLATFLVEIVRGVPVLVLLLYIAFVFFPWVVDGINAVGNGLIDRALPQTVLLGPPMVEPFGQWITGAGIPFLQGPGQLLAGLILRDVPNIARVIFALVLAYGVFLSEIFRAGIQSIEPGQAEAARALGMNRFQVMTTIILPQAIRNILPALGNDFIAMLKDSSLVSVLGVPDLTNQTRLYIASTFRTFEGYNIMAFLYLSMTLILSLVVRWVELRITRYRKTRGQD